MKLTNIKSIISILALSVLASCSKDEKKDKLNPLLSDSQNIVSTRPQNSKQFLAIVKLKNPALLENPQKQNGKSVVDQNLLKEILKEQEETITALKALSSEIQVMYRYKMVLNGLAILAPRALEDRIKGLGQIAYSEGSGNFERPRIMELTSANANPLFAERNSAKFIGAEKLNLSGITGKGIKVAIVDTGIDYTHAMFKGVGTEEAYKAVDPTKPAAGYPNDRVVGGIDLVGTEFDSASPDFSHRIPKPDMNPLDEGGHGTHVAGTVAGLGDGVNTYNGMAPDATLYAVKVFGADGSTSDAVVIAALEYSADPNADGDASDELDVVNMSLGSGYGNPHILYTEAIKNLVNGGTVVVASAGNSGHQNYIVGAPGTSDAALSVAASIDNGDQNWKFNTSKIRLAEGKILLVEAIEAATSKKIAVAGAVTGKLVHIGMADVDLSAEQKAAVKGNVAFIDRGVVTFNEKLKRAAEAGAIGVVVANNRDGAPLAMGTTDNFDFPAIMITQADGNKVKEAQKTNDVTIEFAAEEKIEKPELIDTLTDFTSKGPRSIDGFIKPEISAPGANVISAKMGGGAKAVQMSGTSMAAPHMAGVVALIKQAHPTLTANELKSLAMGTATTISEKGERYSVSLQGSGRVQAEKAALSKLVVAEPAISLGETAVESKKAIRKTLRVKNLSKEDLNLNVIFEGNGFISVVTESSLTVKANQSSTITLSLVLDATKMKEESIREMDGWVKLMSGSEELYRVPVLAIAHKLSAITAGDLVVQASSDRDANGAIAELSLNNANMNSGEALLFNLISKDDRKPVSDSYMASDCDLQAAGYRIVSRVNEKGVQEDILQVAVKTYKPMTTWNSCDISVLIDADGDGVIEQELLGSSLKSIPGQASEEFASTLIDAAKAREIRKNFEAEVEKVKNDPVALAKLKDTEKYDAAFVDQKGMNLYNNSTVVVIEASAALLAKTKEGNLAFKVVVTHNEASTVEFDDYLGEISKSDMRISLRKEDQAFLDLSDMTLKPEETKKVELTKGAGLESLLVLMPQNKFSTSNLVTDGQSQIVKSLFKTP